MYRVGPQSVWICTIDYFESGNAYVILFSHNIQCFISIEFNESIYDWLVLVFIGNLFPKQKRLLDNSTNIPYQIGTQRRTRSACIRSLLLNFVELVSLSMHQDVNVLVKSVIPKIWLMLLRMCVRIHQLFIVLKNLTAKRSQYEVLKILYTDQRQIAKSNLFFF